MKLTCLLVAGLCVPPVFGEIRKIPLTSTSGLQARNVEASPVTFKGRKAIRLAAQPGDENLGVLTGTSFGDGVIELELAGEPAAGAAEGARGFVGVAFRLQPDLKTYQCFYLRPTNGRADDQLRRNHATQYVAHPDWPWNRLRKEFPGVYESYVDILPAEWTKIRVEVRGGKAKLFVHGNPQPVLIVNDMKSSLGKGMIALWVGDGTVAHFSNLKISD
ncbi:MAG: hypothetical protein K2X35_19310 [Bryobacteraceae bacterium]|nr:hypothetical protein [Bryobacteraceae bacterium]